LDGNALCNKLCSLPFM